MGFFKKLKNLCFKKNIKKSSNGAFFKSSTTKCSMTSTYTLKFSAETEKKKKEINDKLKSLVKKYMNEPEKLIQFMKLNGASVYRIKNANKLLSYLGEEEGFLTPLKGFKAIVLNLCIGFIFEKRMKISFSTSPMFIFDNNNTEIYTIARALHKFYGFKNNLPGFDIRSQETFKRIYNNRHKSSDAIFNNCSVRDMYACKEAIARDMESINFTIELSVEYERAKKALEKLAETNSANI